jgi:periplasmic divalent cation tolerance protein
MKTHIQMITTIPREYEAMKIARQLVHERLAACVQVTGPVKNVSWSNGTVTTTDAWVCTIKTRQDCYEAVRATIHLWQHGKVCEISVLPLSSLDEDYRLWLDRELDGPHTGS